MGRCKKTSRTKGLSELVTMLQMQKCRVPTLRRLISAADVPISQTVKTECDKSQNCSVNCAPSQLRQKEVISRRATQRFQGNRRSVEYQRMSGIVTVSGSHGTE